MDSKDHYLNPSRQHAHFFFFFFLLSLLQSFLYCSTKTDSVCTIFLCLFYSLHNIQSISFTLSFKCSCHTLTIRLFSLSVLDVSFTMSLQGWLRKDDRKRLKDRGWGRKRKAMFFFLSKRERKGKRVPPGSEKAPGSNVGLLRGSYEKGK